MVITPPRVQYVFYGHWAGASWVIYLILGGGVVGNLFHTMQCSNWFLALHRITLKF